MKKLKVLSLFNGMNCIGLALHSLGIEFELYASEIDKYANKVSSALFPDTVNLGDVTKIDIESLPAFDLVVGGSPCQGFSFAGKQLNFEDERSKLFFDFVKILEACKKKNPDVKFLLENVRMKKEFEWVISEIIGVVPLKINSSLVSAQNRFRLYWTNIGPQFQKAMFQPISSAIEQPKDKGILLKDILELEVDEKYFLSDTMINSFSKPSGKQAPFKWSPRDGNDKGKCLTARYFKMGRTDNYIKCAAMRGRYKVNEKRQDSKGSIAGKSKQEIEIRKDDKTNCLTSVQKDNLLIVPEATKQGYTEIKDGECVDLTFIDSKTRRGRKMEKKSNCLTAANYDFCQWKDAKIRRLTPKECMRLQTVPEWAIEIMLNCGVSDSQLYKMLGNGWTVDVIAYILKHEYN
jgi:DNA (cytosine-5)-methyltransferase 3A